jgi:hypothetical protein
MNSRAAFDRCSWPKAEFKRARTSPRNEPVAWVDVYSFSFAKRNPNAMNMAPTAR